MTNAVIFDMDGVISATQSIHADVESEFLARHGVFITPEELSTRFAGVKDEDQFKILLGDKLNPSEIEAFITDKWTHLLNIANEVEAVPGAIELIHDLHQRLFPLAVASASISNYVETILKHLGVFDCFSAIICGDMVAHGKPHPEIFLMAAEKLGVQPSECVVIEDGAAGMEAAKAAGMKCIALIDDDSRELPPVTKTVTSLSELSPTVIRDL